MDTLCAFCAGLATWSDGRDAVVATRIVHLLPNRLRRDRAEILSMLEAEAGQGKFLSDPTLAISRPLSEGPGSAVYRLSKFVRRNRTGVIATRAALALLLAGIAGTSVGLVRARQAELKQSRVRQEADNARQEADNARQEAEQASDDEVEPRQIAEAAEREQSRARQEADNARSEAEKQKQQADKATHDAEWQSYVANIYAADLSGKRGDTSTAKRRLDRAPEHLRNGEWGYLRAKADQSILTWHGPDANACYVTFSRDAARFASVSEDHVIRIWDAATMKELATLLGCEDRVWFARFSPDGTRLASVHREDLPELSWMSLLRLEVAPMLLLHLAAGVAVALANPVQNPVQHMHAEAGIGLHAENGEIDKPRRSNGLQFHAKSFIDKGLRQTPRVGLEPGPVSSCFDKGLRFPKNTGAAQSGARGAKGDAQARNASDGGTPCAEVTPAKNTDIQENHVQNAVSDVSHADPGLASIIETWPRLSDLDQEAIVSVVRAYDRARGG